MSNYFSAKGTNQFALVIAIVLLALAAAVASLMAAGFDSVDYVAMVDAETLAEMPEADRPRRLLAAARIGGTRLIDTIPVEAGEQGYSR